MNYKDCKKAYEEMSEAHEQLSADLEKAEEDMHDAIGEHIILSELLKGTRWRKSPHYSRTITVTRSKANNDLKKAFNDFPRYENFPLCKNISISKDGSGIEITGDNLDSLKKFAVVHDMILTTSSNKNEITRLRREIKLREEAIKRFEEEERVAKEEMVKYKEKEKKKIQKSKPWFDKG